MRLTAACILLATAFAGAQTTAVKPATMPRVGTVDERFQSYNVEMVEVTGGRFWRPYDAAIDKLLADQAAGRSKAKASTEGIGLDPALFQYRPPIDLSSPKLRKLAAALGPAYVRVSGTWQNSTFFQNDDAPALAKPPAGFQGVLTRAQWKGVIDFSHAVDAKIISSFATSAGTRDAGGVWTPAMAEGWLAYTKSIGGSIAAAEYMNEPTFPTGAGVPEGYDGKAFARDFSLFSAMLKRSSPQTLTLGPGGVGEGGALAPASMKLLSSEDILKATGPAFGEMSYHFYGAISARCTPTMGAAQGVSADQALSREWLGKTAHTAEFYQALRDRFEPGKSFWLTETAEAACGGDKWASTYLDTFRYLNQLGSLATHGVRVIAHNTLASSDYGLLDETTLDPRPDYWAAWLWRQFMGTTVLDPKTPIVGDLRVYAHCLRGTPGGIALLVLNTGPNAQLFSVPASGERYSLTAAALTDRTVMLNGTALALGPDNTLPRLTGLKTGAGTLTLQPDTITFLTIAKAANLACR